jgi:translation initiation factor 2B subunit (eIF-2B alpha/beta/delta family)
MSSNANLSTANQLSSLLKESNCALPVAAMNVLQLHIRKSQATTWMELESELKSLIDELKSSRMEVLME